MLFHPLNTNIGIPEEMNNPFHYEPHPLCLVAADEVREYIHAREEWREELRKGKMFGVLVVKRQVPDAVTDTARHEIGYLAAYSGQIGGRSDWGWFVPAVFDYLQEGGHFKENEAEITAINHEIERLENCDDLERLRAELDAIKSDGKKAVRRQRSIMIAAKARRDKLRADSSLTEKDKAEMIRESQFLKAELRRIKRAFEEKTSEKETEIRVITGRIEYMKSMRRKKSDSLQQWLFSKFEMLNVHGEKRNLAEIFSNTVSRVPPAGAGECCEPKLLQYAFSHSMSPLAIAMFWVGDSPATEIRHDGHFYPACSGKCKPILTWMLGLSSQETATVRCLSDLSVVYEDDDLIVVNKPAGMLSVPGKLSAESVFDFVCNRCPEADGPMVVHRLDMATSGLLVVAKNKHTHKELQRQFAMHTIKKRYIALLEYPLKEHCGVVKLPLSPDKADRPRQMVDLCYGKPAITRYEVIDEPRTDAQRMFSKHGGNLVALYPETGRTHQLRVHCAHREGLDNPILGDNLYGKKSDRLYLHAEYLEFTHPRTGKRQMFECAPEGTNGKT